ncbi:hypothetical protein [Sphingomonas xinjiangensis]|nr:hypothetical protein [Sphingomonas xinjiangensis]
MMIAGSSSAAAQGRNNVSAFPGSAATNLEAQNRANMNTGGRVEDCLVRKATGKRECRTRAEWRKIAAAMSEQQQRQ